jgi:ketosteroid isomerase-like protein
MQYILLLYARESGWSELTQAQQEQAMGAYNAYTEALKNAGVLTSVNRALIETVHKAHHNKDAATIVARYARDAAVFSLAPPLSHIGMVLEEKKAWLDTWEGPIDLESRDLNITVSGDFAFCHVCRHSGTPKAAGKPISFWMRATVCLHRDGGAWRIVHEHTSVPFYMICACAPDLAVRNHAIPDLAIFYQGPVIVDGDVGDPNSL